jgi:hypothetical protein
MSNDRDFKTPNERLDKFKDLNETTDNETNKTANEDRESGGERSQTLSTQGDYRENEENLGGTTNLSLDQLKEDDGQPDDIDE